MLSKMSLRLADEDGDEDEDENEDEDEEGAPLLSGHR
jgi:hypothetical protein